MIRFLTMTGAACLLLAALAAPALNAQGRYWVVFADKAGHNPLAISPLAQAMRAEKGVAPSDADACVNPEYIAELQGLGARVVSVSRWLNAAAVELTPAARQQVARRCFVREIRPVQTLVSARQAATAWQPALPPRPTPAGTRATAAGGFEFDYGNAREQNELVNIHKLHQRGYTGRGVRVAVFDSGFDGADTIDALDSVWIQRRVIAHRDFVRDGKPFFGSADEQADSHGTQVWSTIGANQPGEMVGTAPHASFILGRTEQSASETHQEEHNWVAAMEWADSLGVDLIHSSLGYGNFDGDTADYTYADMDGDRTIISRAADVAASRGIIITVSAGNEGDGDWHYITAPCDADSVLCVGAVKTSGKRAYFSSFGPTSDGRVKPDVMAVGENTVVASPRNYITTSNGTSFSGPLIAGTVASLKQAHPKRSNMDLIQAMRLSSDQYPFPDEEYGYGIPDLAKADSILANFADLRQVRRDDIAAKPERSSGGVTLFQKRKEVVFADAPKTRIERQGTKILVTTPGGGDTVELMFGRQRVTLLGGAQSRRGKVTTIDLKSLLDGEYYLHVAGLDVEENVKFKK